MNTTPYTDDQILEAIEQALGYLDSRDMIMVCPGTKWRACWDSEKDVRLQIGKKFLELLSKTQPEPDPYATLKAYNKAGARIRLNKGTWRINNFWAWTDFVENYEVHPDDLHMVPEYAPVNEQPNQQVPLGPEQKLQAIKDILESK